MSRMASPRLAKGISALWVLLLVTGEVMSSIAHPDAVLRNLVEGGAYVVGFGSVGWLLVRRLPRNPIGWLLSLSALASALGLLAHGWVALALTGHVQLDTLARASAVVDAYIWVVAAALGVSLPLLLLPDGRLPSPRWRPVVWAVVAGAVIGATGYVTLPGSIADPYRALANPFGQPALSPLPVVLAGVGLATLLAGTAAGIAALVRRFGRSSGGERQQLRWVAFGGSIALAAASISFVGQARLAGYVAGMVAAGALPVCIGVAVLRYRLYDLGRVVSRTVSYAVLTALLVGVYLTLVTTSTRLLPNSSALAVAASTLAAAGLFQPLRRRVQAVVDHKFNRARYDADRTVEAFTRRLRQEVDLEAVRSDLMHVVLETLQPASAGLWLRDVGR